MTEELETALARTFKNAAERAPKAPLGIGLEPRTRRAPRGYSRMALTAAAVAVAVGGATLGGRTLLSGAHSSGTTARHPSAAASPALHRPKKAKVPPIQQVWPKAAHQIPDTLPNGHAFRPEAFVDDHTLLVSTESSFEKSNALYAYDLRTHHTRLITQVVTPPKTKMFASNITVGDGYAGWALAGDYGTEIWAAPLTGGQAHLVTRTNTRPPSQLTISGGKAIWSAHVTGGVYQAPIGGGAAHEVPGSRSMYILAWPWIGSPPGQVASPKKGVVFAKIKNVLTGETRSATLTDQASWKCGLTWCTGEGPNFVTEVQRRDGSGRQAIPSGDSTSAIPPILDRFVITFPSGGTIAVYDLRTGRIGDLRTSPRKNNAYLVPQDPANRLYTAFTAGGYVVVDLGAI
ncbi:hypothetical protein GCM10027176_78520 [Actinoallomurus bryophytorum]|uniref:Uncharacterized protein n=1 Tax=Actinoallomurus bryophytorum TaxID=1490222 RepID=A0A543CFN1_9ACTN|nr:hypothetical protein [Actinoallomurus bryophytorum]TQL95908.1 hypothetical protein FB559_1420 [Actinoallomurus bryophytorum]